jgi:hypothetical protein
MALSTRAQELVKADVTASPGVVVDEDSDSLWHEVHGGGRLLVEEPRRQPSKRFAILAYP